MNCIDCGLRDEGRWLDIKKRINYLLLIPCLIGLVAISCSGATMTIGGSGQATNNEQYVAPAGYHNAGEGIPVYRQDECVGAVVNGECHGGIVPKSAWQTKCYGDMINGQCTGPMF